MFQARRANETIQVISLEGDVDVSVALSSLQGSAECDQFAKQLGALYKLPDPKGASFPGQIGRGMSLSVAPVDSRCFTTDKVIAG